MRLDSDLRRSLMGRWADIASSPLFSLLEFFDYLFIFERGRQLERFR